MTEKARIRNRVQVDGKSVVVGAETITVFLQDSDGMIMDCSGTTVPTDDTAGYAKGCRFVDTDVVDNTSGVYENIGTTVVCEFNAVSVIDTNEITDAAVTRLKMSEPAGAESVCRGIGAVPTTGSVVAYIFAPEAGSLSSADFTGVEALTVHDTNYATFTITNLGQAGSGSAVMLAATDANTTKATGGTALAAKGKRALTLTETGADLVVAKGDVLEITVAASGTLANTITLAVAILRFSGVS